MLSIQAPDLDQDYLDLWVWALGIAELLGSIRVQAAQTWE